MQKRVRAAFGTNNVDTCARVCHSPTGCGMGQTFGISAGTQTRFPLLLTTGRILRQYNLGARTRRTPNNQWHDEGRLDIHPHDVRERGVKVGDWVGIESRAGQTVLRAQVNERMQPGVVHTTFPFPESGANVITTDSSDWATNCPEYKVTAVQVLPVAQPSVGQQG